MVTNSTDINQMNNHIHVPSKITKKPLHYLLKQIKDKCLMYIQFLTHFVVLSYSEINVKL